MASVPVPITVDGDTYKVPGADTIEPLAVSVTYDGTDAAGAFMPCLTYYTQSGQIISRTYPASAVAAGASAEVSFIPFVPPASGTGGGAGLLVQEIQFQQQPVGTGQFVYVAQWAIPAGAWIVDILAAEYTAWTYPAAEHTRVGLWVSDDDFPLLPWVGGGNSTYYGGAVVPPIDTVGGGGALGYLGYNSSGRVPVQQNAWVRQGAATEVGAGKQYPTSQTLAAIAYQPTGRANPNSTGDWRVRVLYLMPNAQLAATGP